MLLLLLISEQGIEKVTSLLLLLPLALQLQVATITARAAAATTCSISAAATTTTTTGSISAAAAAAATTTTIASAAAAVVLSLLNTVVQGLEASDMFARTPSLSHLSDSFLAALYDDEFRYSGVKSVRTASLG